MTGKLILSSSLWFCCILLSNYVFAQSGLLDKSFGIGGKVITPMDSFRSDAFSIKILPDQKFLVSGVSYKSFTQGDFAIVRYDNDGSVDSTFGVNGIAKTFVENRSTPVSMAVQPDSKILLGGYSKWFVNLVRYQNNGNIDSTFGTNGIVITDVDGYYGERCLAISILPSGKILAGGYAQQNSNDRRHFSIIKYQSNGSVDSSFGIDGSAIGMEGSANSMMLKANGKIILGGSSDNAFAMQQFNADGSVDSTFGTNGIVTVLNRNTLEIKDILEDQNGQIIAGGVSSGANLKQRFAVARFNPNGNLDSTFAIDGIATLLLGDGHSEVAAISIQPNGKILATGKSNDGTNSQFTLLRYNDNGVLDNNFGNGGIAINSFGNSYSIARDMAIGANGDITVIGSAYDGSKTDFALARYQGDTPILFENNLPTQSNNKVFPNPFGSAAIIQLDSPIENGQIFISNMKGQILEIHSNVQGAQIEIGDAGLLDGLYFLQIKEGSRMIWQQKVAVSNY